MTYEEREFTSTPYALRLAEITERYIRIVGVLIGVCLVSSIMTAVGLFLVVDAKSQVDTTKTQMCAGFEDVIAKALLPLRPPENATPEQIASYANSNAQKLARIAALKGELTAHAHCVLSVNQ